MTALRTWRSVRLSLVRERSDQPYTLRGPDGVAALARAFIGDEPREVFCAIYLDSRHRPLAVHRVSVGTAEVTTVHPREVYGPALMLGAVRIVVAHNHPSGDPAPSAEDRMVTERLRQAGQLLGVEMLDHVVLGSERFYSFAEEATRVYGAP
jgi:DNA repair protein RadC